MKSYIEQISTANMSRADWLAERRKSLGGSDMGAVLGLNPWRSPYAVWAEKTGRVTDDRDTEAMRIGRDLEDYVAKRFCEASGKKVRRMNAILRNKRKAPWIHANVDRLVVGEESGLECKTASALNESKFAGGEFPATYYAQCVTYLAVTEYDRWYLAVLVMGREFKVFQMTRIPDDPCPAWCESSVYVSNDEIDALITAAATFWDCVEHDEEPDVDGSEATTKALQTIYADGKARCIDIWSADVRQAVAAYLKLKAEEKDRKKLLDEQANIIRAYMGDAEAAECDAAKVSWKNQTRESFDRDRFALEHPEIKINDYMKTSTSRVFKITAKKGA